MDVKEYARWRQKTLMGASLTLATPTGREESTTITMKWRWDNKTLKSLSRPGYCRPMLDDYWTGASNNGGLVPITRAKRRGGFYMAVNIYMKLGDVKGESLDDKHKNWIETTTVQAGETSIGQMAKRMGINGDDLLLANPHIKDPSRLNVGQEINLPARPTPKSEAVHDVLAESEPPKLDGNSRDPGFESEAARHETNQGKLPPHPLGDPMNASMTKAKLEALRTQSANIKPTATDSDKQKMIEDVQDKFSELHKQPSDNAKF